MGYAAAPRVAFIVYGIQTFFYCNHNNDYVSYLYRALYYDNKRSNRFTRVGGGLLYGTSGSRNNSYMKVTNRI